MSKQKLPEPFKRKWIAALRSGKYVQTNGFLYAGLDEEGKPRMCCLGVAEHVLGTPLHVLKDRGFPIDIPKGASKVPELIRSGDGDSLGHKLSIYNDGQTGKLPAKSFNWIASYIERYL